MMKGWISLHRRIQDHWLWKEKPFSRAQAWIDMLLMASHCENRFVLGNELIDIEVGEFVTSEVKLMQRWGWSKTKVRAFLSLLQNDSMIIKKTDRKKTTIIIVNYSDYQVLETTKEPKKNHEKTTKRPQKDTINNENTYNNDNKNIYTIEFEDFYKQYPNPQDKHRSFNNWKKAVKEYSVDAVMKAVTNYALKVKDVDRQFIKTSANFLGKDKFYVDYINYKPEAQEYKSLWDGVD